MAKGYLGISIDEFGNFSSASDGGKNGGPGKIRGSVVIRGPGDGRGPLDYVYQTGVDADDPLYNAGFLGFTQRYPDSTTANYRRIKIILTPGSTLGTDKGYKITIILYKGGVPVTPVTLINNFDYPFIAPLKLQYGLAASTGSITDFHEIRNVNIDVTNTSALLSPTINNDNVAICQEQQAIVDVTSNDISNNAGGSIDETSVDLNPLTSGLQTTFTDPGKGVYTVDQNGIVTFTPVVGFSGTSMINYKVDDNFGVSATNSAVISVTVNSGSALTLTITNPSAVCTPVRVNITDPSYKSDTTPGTSYDYFANLTDANNNSNNINSTASNTSVGGTYYIRGNNGGCAIIQPIVVRIDNVPTSSNAGPDQSFCSSTGAQSTTLLGNNPSVGSGTWTQVSGPSTASIIFPNSANSPVSNMQKGIYAYRWSVSNGACAVSMDQIQITVGITSIAGSNQSLCNATTATLQGNAAAPGTGNWTQVSGPAVTINEPANPLTTVNGLNAGNVYIFSWAIINGSCNSSSQVTVTDYTMPIADAGSNQIFINTTSTMLQGNTPAAGSGVWTQVSGPAATISAPANPTSTVNGLLSGNTYVFAWTVTNGSCNSSSQVTLNTVLNTVANAGPDQSVSNTDHLTLNGNAPDAGNTAVWTLLSSPSGAMPVISQPNNPISTVTMISRTGDYNFRWTMTNGAFSNIDEVKITVLTLLPVDLISFTGMQENTGVLLKWETASENKNDHFDLERSVNGNVFSKIAIISGTGTSFIVNRYVYTDDLKDIVNPIVYYRLLQVDKDGKSSYSKIVKINLNTMTGILSWPNPFRKQINIKGYFTVAGTARINLYDNTGKTVKQLQQQVNQGLNYILLDNLQSNLPGVFILEIRKGKTIHRHKLSKE